MRVSSPVTKHNPRPRKYASAAARQAAYRARNEMLEFRAEPHTAETLTRIADTIDVSRSDLLLSMVKYALANHDWARFGLTHKTIPHYQGNPIMATKKPTPAQLAARKLFAKLFAERAKAKTLTKKKKASRDYARDAAVERAEAELRLAKKIAARRKTNPRKKTVSQKVSQMVHEGYPQRQAVAVALSEQRAGKVKRNPTAKTRGKVSAVVLMKNPSAPKKLWTVHRADANGSPVYHIAHFSKKADAVQYAKAYADHHGKQVVITSKAV